MSFGGKKKATVYGELPGVGGAGQSFLDTVQKWLSGLQGGGATTPGLGAISGMIPGLTGLSNIAGARAGEMMSPGWLDKTSPGLQKIIDSMQSQNEEDKQKALGATRMRFASAGHGLSSPMMRAELDTQLGADRNLQSQIGNLLYSDYGAKRSAQMGMIPGLMQAPLNAAGTLSSQSMNLLQLLLQYATGGRGQMAQQQQSGGMNPFLKVLLGAGLGAATGGAGSWATGALGAL